MLRTVLLLCLVPSPTPPPPDAPAPKAAPAAEEPRLVINDQTEVLLDGKACKFADVPPGASVVNLSVAADRKTILKIYFESPKGKP